MSLSVRDKQSELNEMKAGSQVHAQVGNLPSEGNGSGHTKPRKKPVEPAVVCLHDSLHTFCVYYYYYYYISVFLLI